MSKTPIRVDFEKTIWLPIEEFTEFQGELKSLSTEAYQQLRGEILGRGFSFVPHVWPNEGKYFLLDGHQRLRTVKRMVQYEGYELEKLPANVIHAASYKEAKHKLLAATSQYGKIEPQGLYQFISDAGFEPTELETHFRFPEVDLKAFKAEFFDPAPTPGEDSAAGGPPADPVSKRGDLWILGDHRVICGDSTSIEDVSRLLDGQKADMVFTDPPWNVNYGAQDHPTWKPRTIMNDHMDTEDWEKFVSGIAASLAAATKPGAPLYCVMSAQEWPVIDHHLRKVGFHWSSTIIWAKDRLVLSRKDYHTQYEPIWYGWNENAPRLVQVEDRKQSDLWQVARPSSSELHPTTKPIELVERAIGNSSNPGGLILDLFGGSGSTLIAAHNLRRRAALAELDPKYCDVILQRFADHTGIDPVRADDKASFAELKKAK